MCRAKAQSPMVLTTMSNVNLKEGREIYATEILNACTQDKAGIHPESGINMIASFLVASRRACQENKSAPETSLILWTKRYIGRREVALHSPRLASSEAAGLVREIFRSVPTCAGRTGVRLDTRVQAVKGPGDPRTSGSAVEGHHRLLLLRVYRSNRSCW